MDTAGGLHDDARMTAGRLVAMFLGVFLGIGACGGSTPSGGGSHGGGSAGSAGDGGGGRSGGSGGSGSGGTAGSAGEGRSGGSGGCGEEGGGIDCMDRCTEDLFSPDCVNGSWVCAETSPCPDCGAGQVRTFEGCMTCDAVTAALSEALETERLANAGCRTVADCVLTASDTACRGTCPVAVSVAGERAFTAALSWTDRDYCSEFAAECGYSTPKCAAPKLECQTGLCQTVYP